MAQQWFVKTKSGAVGPITPQKLKELASSGKLNPRSPISLDGKKWIAAETVQGLFAPVEELELAEDDLFSTDASGDDFDAQAELNALGLGVGGLPQGMFAIPPKTSGLVKTRETLYEKCFGPYSHVSHPLGPEMPHIDVYVYPPHGEREFTTLVTGGMSDHAMPVPPGGPSSNRCELMFYVEEPEEIYIDLLRFVASMPYNQKTWFSYGSTLNNGSPPQPIFADSVLDHFAFLLPFLDEDFDIPATVSIEGSPLQLLMVTPITAAERKVMIQERHGGIFPSAGQEQSSIDIESNAKLLRQTQRLV